jgi:hypothetical protein
MPLGKLAKFQFHKVKLESMPWEISWLDGTREQLQALARKQFSKSPVSEDIGQLVVQKVEEEIRLHPLPSPDLPQLSGNEVFKCGPIEVEYHTDSLSERAEIRSVKGL